MRARRRATPSSVMWPVSAMPTLPSIEYRMQSMPEAALPQTIPGVVARAAEQFATLEALVDERERLTFAQLADARDRPARAR